MRREQGNWGIGSRGRKKIIFHVSFFNSHLSLKDETAKTPRAAEDAKKINRA
jgi:hypothetical protein